MAIGHRILVPLDGSDFAERVLPLATAIARHAGGSLHLVNAYEPWAIFEGAQPEAELFAMAERQTREQMERYMDGVAGGLREAGLEVEVELRRGVADHEILDACAASGCDLIAMATHGQGGFTRLWLGSVADRVVRRAEVPVLLVSAAGRSEPAEREEAVELSATPRDIRTVIIPLDGSPLSEEVLVPATALGDAFAAEYVLFRAVPRPALVAMPAIEGTATIEEQVLEKRRATARRELEGVAARLREAGYTVTVTVAEDDEPVPTLLRLVEATPDAVIAMSTHGKGGLRRLAFGSVADKVVRATTRPVLLVRAADRDADAAPDSSTA